MGWKTCGILSAWVLMLMMPSACGFAQDHIATETSWFRSWTSLETATGNWGGLRDKLEDQGITISSNYTTDICGNPSGGLEQRTEYAGFLDISVAFDLEKIASVKGMALTVGNCLASGRNLSDAVGNIFWVQEIYVPGDYYLGEINLSQSLFDDTVTLEAGRLLADDVFATSPLWAYYVSGGINDYFSAISNNIFFPSFQIASWAARASYEPNDEWQIIAGIYNADPSVAEIDKHGADLNFRTKDGYLAIGQLTYKHHQKREDNGLPGSTRFGGYYESSKFPDVSDPDRTWRGNYGLYLIFDQMIFRGDWPEFKGPSYMRAGAKYSEQAKDPYDPQTATPADRPKGLTLWAAAYLAPESHSNVQTYQLTGGLIYQGLPSGRDHDVTAFCVIIGGFSDELPGQGCETVLEINHRFQVGPWFYITPDIQYVINPNGENSIRDALVLGLEISVSL